MERRDSIIALTVSLLLHLILFVQLTANANNSQAQAPQLSTRVSLNLMPPPQQPPQPVKAEQPKPKPKLEPKTEPKAKEKPPKKVEAIKPEPKVVPEQAVATKVAEQIQRETGKDNAAIKKEYLKNLLTHVEGNKYYPSSARRRGMEANIEVSFILLRDGTISKLKISGGPKILRNAAEQAITKTLPFEMPPSEVNCPLSMSYVMQFELQQ
ncbi:MAG: TonB family protein [Gammaproteobacteria bacterium]|nr:TonB family protein [Gammaproteobacteria bacterium]